MSSEPGFLFQAPLRACLIGEGGLLAECADILLAWQINIAAIVSTDPKVVEWSKEQGIACVATLESLPLGIRLQDCDYLFSIINPRILPETVLRAPRHLAVNYHDGPLPRYGGVHATSWAILNGEPEHGVTWHVMTSGVDAGDILKQRCFPVDQAETALSLNLKCYREALVAFRELVSELLAGTVQRLPQNPQARTYYGLTKKPAFGGVIDWRKPASETERMWRALDFGPSPNRLCRVKAWIGNQILLVKALQQLPEETAKKPGTVLAVEANGIRVATGNGDLTIQLEELEQKLHPGQQLPLISDAELSISVGPKQDYPSVPFTTYLQPSEARAVTYGGQTWSYGELLRRADQIACKLRQDGIRAEAIVGVQLERSLDLLATLLGIWKAGGAYLPLDPTYPAERLRFMREDSRAALTIEAEYLVDLPAEKQALEEGSGATLDHLAYVIYTSGSTGQPKGVPVTHRSLMSFLQAMRRETRIGPGDVFTAVTTLSFDISAMELFLPLLAGAELVIAPRQVAIDGAQLAHLLHQSQTSILFGTPATWRLLLDAGWQGCAGLRILCGGEAMTPTLAAALLQRGATVWNMFGPTETTICSVMTQVQSGREEVPIGKPVANTETLVVDVDGIPVPIGVEGELWIGGIGVARGYLHRAELTATKFGRDRRFRTGDRVVMKEGGELLFRGRMDQQVKIRGFRVEPGEIEAVLLRHPHVREAAVLAEEDRLTAYLVATGQDTEALRHHLSAALPEHMVPARFVFLSAMPLTPNGKLDRHSLQREKEVSLLELASPGPFGSATEEQIAAIFQEVLRVEHIGAEGNFFHLGGHSLLAAKVIARITRHWNLEVDTRVLFEAPTVRAFALRIEELKEQASTSLAAANLATQQVLSFAQERLWFLQRFHEAEAALYNIPARIRLRGTIHKAALEQALDQVVQRHEVLRTIFPEQDGIPYALVRASLRATLSDQENPTAPFSLAVGPLLRTALVPVREGEWDLYITLHHIVADGWSLGVLLREVAAFYRGNRLPPLPMQYAEFSRQQRERLRGPVLEQHVLYWRNQLAGLPGLLALPADRPRPAMQTYRATTLRLRFPPSLERDLPQLSLQCQATLFMTLLAAFQILLSRYGGETEICVGTSLANRTQVDTEGMIGLFANTLPLRGSTAGNPAFREMVHRVRNTTLGAFAHGELPFEKIVEALQPERTVSYTPFFQTMFTLQNALTETLDLPGVEAESVVVESELVKVDLAANVEQHGSEWSLVLEYNQDLFDASRIERMAGHYFRLLQSATQDPDCAVGELQWLTVAEEQQILLDWNHTEAPFPEETVPKLLMEQVRSRPEAIAVECGGERLTYADLLHRAEKVGRRVNPGTLQPVIVNRTVDLIPQFLGVWLGGSAYVPLDPEHPPARLEFIRDDAARPGTIPEGLAYVMYTSGSTGKPKGVLVGHRSVVNLLHAMRNITAVNERSVLLAVTTAAFDISVLELFLPLLAGGRVVVATTDEVRDPLLLAALLKRSGATVMQATPATWNMLLEHGWQPPPGLQVLCGGEALPPSLAEKLIGRGNTVWNLFGPTETTIWSTVARVGQGPVTIGRALPNTKLYVLDDRQSPVPVGIPGELYIGGEGLAYGYWQRPELTAERFVTHPRFGRLYRTGDLVQWRENGELDFLRRLDHQIKLRGHRIEVREIESALELHPAVRRAAVAVKGDTLMAWLAAQECSPESIRQFLSEKLPSYMVPAQYVCLPDLPVSANGKLDRNALAAMAPASVSETQTITEPRDEWERRVLKVWEEVLGLGQLSTTDSFFALGGHSLQAARLQARLQQETGERLPLAELFAGPTVQETARFLRKKESAGLPEGLAAIQRNGTKTPLFLVEARSAFFPFAKLLGPDQPVFGMDWPDPATLPQPQSIAALAEYFVQVIRSYQPHGPYLIGGWCIAGIVAFEIAQQLTAAGEEVKWLLLFDGANLHTLFGRTFGERTRGKLLFWWHAATFHLRHLAHIQPNERLRYLVGRWQTVRIRAGAVMRRVFRRNQGMRISCVQKITALVQTAATDYRPVRYRGRVAYFRRGTIPGQQGFDPQFGWGDVVERGLKVIETTGRHGEMWHSPHVESMAAAARELLKNEDS